MINVVIGAIGFWIIHLYDIVSLKRLHKVKPITRVVGIGLLIYPFILLYFAPGKLLLPMWSTWLGSGLIPISLFLLLYPLFLNLPLDRIYINATQYKCFRKFSKAI